MNEGHCGGVGGSGVGGGSGGMKGRSTGTHFRPYTSSLITIVVVLR